MYSLYTCLTMRSFFYYSLRRCAGIQLDFVCSISISLAVSPPEDVRATRRHEPSSRFNFYFRDLNPLSYLHASVPTFFSNWYDSIYCPCYTSIISTLALYPPTLKLLGSHKQSPTIERTIAPSRSVPESVTTSQAKVPCNLKDHRCIYTHGHS